MARRRFAWATGVDSAEENLPSIMKNLRRYIGRLVRIHPGQFGKLLDRARRRGQFLENRFLIGAVTGKGRKLVCYGFNLRLEVAAGDIVLV